jgi:hypothetical protein
MIWTAKQTRARMAEFAVRRIVLPRAATVAGEGDRRLEGGVRHLRSAYGMHDSRTTCARSKSTAKNERK